MMSYGILERQSAGPHAGILGAKHSRFNAMRKIGRLRWLAAVLCCCVWPLLCDPATTPAQMTPVVIQVDARASEGELRPVRSTSGYKEPTSGDALNCRSFFNRLLPLSPAPVY